MRRPRFDRELDQELASYVTLLTDRHVAQGLSPEAARREAMLAVGGVEQVKEQVRDVRLGHGVETAWMDAQYAWRGIRGAPLLALTIVATLGLGVGATTAIFSAVHGLLIEPLPYRDADRLVFIWSNLDQAGYPRAPISGPELADVRTHVTQLEDAAGIWATTAALTGDGDAEQLRVGHVTPNFFSVLGVEPLLGRTFVSDDADGASSQAVVLSHDLWRRRFGGDETIVGRRISMNGTPATVVGVMPERFGMWFPADANVPDDLQAWRPFPGDPARGPRALYYIRAFGRLQRGATAGSAHQEIERLGRQISREHSEYAASGRSLFAVPLQADSVREVRPALLALFGGVLIVLAIASVNVAGLLVARAAARRGETALRVALGASRIRLVRLHLFEGLILAAFGGLAGVVLARVLLTLAHLVRPETLARLHAATIDPGVMAFALGVSLLFGLAFSLAPLTEVLRLDLLASLRGTTRDARHPLRHRTRAALVIAEVALGVVLLVGAGLLLRGFIALQRVDAGFAWDDRSTFRLALPAARYSSLERVNTFSRELEARIRSLPGVLEVGSTSHLPYDYLPNWSSPYATERNGAERRGANEADARAVNPAFFAAVGARLVEGRVFTEDDGPEAPPVVIVDERLAQRAWPGASAIGQRLNVGWYTGNGFVPTWATVVGVVKHLRHRSLAAPVREQLYQPYRQTGRSPVAYVVRTTGDPAALGAPIRRIVAMLDKDLPVYDVRPLRAYTADAIAGRRFSATLASAFGAVALLMACIGLYGVLAFVVARRRHEIGVRLALGAGRPSVVRLVLAEGAWMTAVGVLIGIGASAVVARLLAAQLFAVSPYDPATYAVVAALIGLASLLACAIPAVRASRVSPVEALRAG